MEVKDHINQLFEGEAWLKIAKKVVNLGMMVLKETCDVTIILQTKVNENIQVVALAFHTICSPLPRVVNIHEYTSLQNLDLADCLTTGEAMSHCKLNVDVSIG